MVDRWATFDCYGTLIDWEQGIQGAFLSLWPDADAERLLDLYHEIEPKVQERRDIPYREVLGEVLRQVAAHEGLPLRVEDETTLGVSLSAWPAFPEVPAALSEARSRGWKLAILSNTDPDLLSASLGNVGVPVDLTVTAAEAGSYKPAHGHWDRFFELSGADRAGHVHVGGSLFHDIVPASDMGLRTVWINRLGEATNLPRDAELLDLTELPDTLDALVPA
ncbi:MAG: HAD hydrolase-like protein [Actinomycetota bacterium]|nr:HAD hydrolase-like protein [Actinomycetota bacterium]